MNNRVLAGARLVVLSSLEVVRAELYAQLAIDGWQADAVFSETLDELKLHLKDRLDDALVIIAEPHGLQAERFYAGAIALGASPNQIVLGCVRTSFTHRMLARNGVINFPFELQSTPLGPQIDIAGLPTSLLSAWKNRISMQLDSEIKTANEHGALVLLAATLRLPNTGMLKERAHLAFAIANHIKSDARFRKRVIRLALYSDIILLHQWQSLVDGWRDVWPIKDLLEYSAQWNRTEVGTIKSLPKDIPLELAIIEITRAIQLRNGPDHNGCSDTLNSLTSELPLEIRAALRMAVDASLKRLREMRHVAA